MQCPCKAQETHLTLLWASTANFKKKKKKKERAHGSAHGLFSPALVWSLGQNLGGWPGKLVGLTGSTPSVRVEQLGLPPEPHATGGM